MGEGNALGSLGLCYYSLGDYRCAIDYHEQSLAITHEIGNRHAEGAVLANLGDCYDSLGDYRRAIDYYEQSLAIAREIGSRYVEGNDLVCIGNLYADSREFIQACDCYREAIGLAGETGNRQNQHEARFGLAEANLLSGDLAAAHTAIDAAREYDYPQNNAAAWTMAGIVRLRQGEPDAAREAFSQGLTVAEGLLELSDQNLSALETKALALCGLALCGNTRRLTAASQSFRTARQITTAKGVVTRLLNRFDALAIADADGILAPVQEVAAGRG